MFAPVGFQYDNAMESESHIIWSVLFGGIGIGFFIYGKRQKALVPWVAGVSLFIFPYFVSDIFMLVAIGIGLIALPYFLRI